MNVLLTTVNDFVRHGKDWLAIAIVYLVGVYWGLFNVDDLAGYYSEYTKAISTSGEIFVSDSKAAVLVLTKSYVSLMILCFLIILSGIFFGFVSMLLIAIQGMYMGFWLHWLNAVEVPTAWYLTGLVGITEIIQVIFMISAGALGFRLGKMLVVTFYEIFAKKPVKFRDELNAWWNQTLRYSMLAMFVLGINALLKAALVYMV